MNKLQIDINCDLGESYGRFKVGQDEQIMPLITSCNIACGFHGGDPLTIQRTIELALKYKVQIGAHPSYPDLAGFGRRKMDLPLNELKSLMMYQVSALKGMLEGLGGSLKHVKPHGALYNVMAVDESVARCIMEAILKIDSKLILVGPAGQDWYKVAQSMGCHAVQEVFSDRNYNEDLTLVSRTLQNAMINTIEDRVSHVKRIVLEKKVKTLSNHIVPIAGNTICIHGDHELAPTTAKQIRSSLESNGVIIQSYA
jgi:UPF0271 protein